MNTTSRQINATRIAIMRIAHATANQAKGKRKQDAIEHCKRLGIDPNKRLQA